MTLIKHKNALVLIFQILVQTKVSIQTLTNKHREYIMCFFFDLVKTQQNRVTKGLFFGGHVIGNTPLTLCFSLGPD